MPLKWNFPKIIDLGTFVWFFCWLCYSGSALHGSFQQKIPTDGFNHWGFNPPRSESVRFHTPNPKEEITTVFLHDHEKELFFMKEMFVFNKIYCNKSLLYIITFLLQDWFIFCHLHFFSSSFLGSKSPFIDRSGLKQMSTHCLRVRVVDPQRRAKDVNQNHSDLAGDTCQWLDILEYRITYNY